MTNTGRCVNSKIHICPLTIGDWPHVHEIYGQGIETGHATFQQEVPEWEEWNQNHISACRIIAKIDEKVAGWAALTAVSGRCVYAGVAEVSVYVSSDFRGQRVGRKLLEELINESERHGYWMLQAGIFPENAASIKIHELTGFRQVGYREKIGQINGEWKNVILMERRSKLVGV